MHGESTIMASHGSLPAGARFRFAPSPTGRLHVGNARTALFSWLWARRLGGGFVLRVEDSDAERLDPQAERTFLDDLRWLGLDWDEGPDTGGPRGPYRQSERRSVYERVLVELVRSGAAYPCFCTPEELARRRESRRHRDLPPRYDGRCRDLTSAEVERRLAAGDAHVWRFRIPDGGAIEFTDLVYGPHRIARAEIDDFILVRTSGAPTFLFANAVDDALMGITHVVRGVDHLDNTPRQILLLSTWGRPLPLYAHLPLIHAADTGPLAKREGTGSLGELRRRGLRPEALRAYLLHLGHQPPPDGDPLGPIHTLPFAPDRLGRSAARFEERQLQTWQERALAALSDREYVTWLAEQVGVSLEDPRACARALASRTAVVWAEDARRWWTILTEDPPVIEGFDEDERGILSLALEIEKTRHPDFASLIDELARRSGRRGRALFLPLRLALTGRHEGPELAVLWNVLDQDTRARRLARALAAVSMPHA